MGSDFSNSAQILMFRVVGIDGSGPILSPKRITLDVLVFNFYERTVLIFNFNYVETTLNIDTVAGR